MSIYVKVDDQGNVIEFPYRQAMNLRPHQSLPADAVKVDTTSKKPTNVKWYEGLWFDRVEKEGDSYVLYYRKDEKKWSSPDVKKETLRTLIRMARLDIDKLQDDNEKLKKLAVLDSIDVENPVTYDNYHNLES